MESPPSTNAQRMLQAAVTAFGVACLAGVLAYGEFDSATGALALLLALVCVLLGVGFCVLSLDPGETTSELPSFEGDYDPAPWNGSGKPRGPETLEQR